MIYGEDPFRRRPRKSTARQKTMGEVRLDGEKSDRMAFKARADTQNQAIDWLRRKLCSLDGGTGI